MLYLLPSTLSVREIGRELHISRNTVKSHLRAIYSKLGVSTRDDAVARGHELGYLNRRPASPAKDATSLRREPLLVAMAGGSAAALSALQLPPGFLRAIHP